MVLQLPLRELYQHFKTNFSAFSSSLAISVSSWMNFSNQRIGLVEGRANGAISSLWTLTLLSLNPIYVSKLFLSHLCCLFPRRQIAV